ncbi:hypothetical protein [Priestia koreensis]|uniref:Uncharacterized protein n=1 Tax=Priestia koreensis TaxID=284581 RepID=A0A0M0KW93_9BACI|nr:hypothetical protein [Priestia koreensis]KOO43086.1 hypothetical protein AMD01_16185 [Priestia koreensis]
MNLSFWEKVQTSWQSVQSNLVESAIDLTAFRDVLQKDIRAMKDESNMEDIQIELSNDDDFWGEL